MCVSTTTSHNIDSLRSLENPSAIYVSEADFLPQLSDIRDCSERYISKSNPIILLESTIGSNTGLLHEIWNEEPSLYTKVRINYLDALAEGMYLPEEIKKAKQSRSFNRELLCDFNAISNVSGTFPPEWVSNAFKMNVDITPIQYVLGIDSGWHPARSGVTLLGIANNGMKQVIISEEFDESEDHMVELIIMLKNQFNVKNIFVDASDKRLIRRLKTYTNDRIDWEQHIEFLKASKILSQYNPLKSLMTVVPILFSQKNNREMLSYVRLCLEQSSVSIPSNCTTLERALFNATDIDGDLQKGPLSHGGGGDCYDSFQIALYGVDN
jgi:hypothetical protein